MFQVLAGDCREVMATLEAESVDAIVTDPPYELGFMGKSWDASGVAFDPETWRHALRVLKPGGHLLAFSGSRTYHRMACAIEDAGFEIRDQIMWVYGSGFPKSHDVSKAIDASILHGKSNSAGIRSVNDTQAIGYKLSGLKSYTARGIQEGYKTEKSIIREIAPITAPATDAARTWSGWGTALKPAHEPIVVARKPFKGTVAQNVLAHGTGALNIDGCRVGGGPSPSIDRRNSGAPKMEASMFRNADHKHDREAYERNRPGEHLGRWPANFIHDGSDEVLRLFPETGPSKASARGGAHPNPNLNDWGRTRKDGDQVKGHDDAGGSAARFFYVPKASKRDREDGLEGFAKSQVFGTGGSSLDGISNTQGPRANHHPTVKPTDLMRYLCRLVTPPGGLVLDPFTGSGSTGRGAVLEGFRFIGIEMDAGYREIAIARIESAERSSHGAS